MDYLWPNLTPKSLSNNLYKTVHAARRTLEPDLSAGSDSQFIRTQDQQIILCAPGVLRIDVEIFERQAADAMKHGDPAACEAALALYEGDLLAEYPYEGWAAARREHLRSTHQSLLLKCGKLYMEAGQYERSICLLKDLIACDPSNEEAFRQLMLLYELNGDRHEATRVYERCRKALRVESDAEPGPETVKLYRQIASGCFPHPAQTGTQENATTRRPGGRYTNLTLTNLPQRVTSFIGREQEIAEVKRLLSTSRLLTLTGTGGMGKTRLALRVASESVGTFADGVWLVELASLTDERLVPRALALVLGVREEPGRTLTSALGDYLRARHMLLVLDNGEHLVEACAALVEQLLSVSPKLHILVTSRERLNVPGEAVWQVAALSLPDSGQAVTVEDAASFEAVRLFLSRAALSNPRWSLTQRNVAAVARLCRKLDGIPLALEFAAARVRVLTVEQILAKLHDRFHLLSSGGRSSIPRHQTLGTTMDWSYSLLRDEERALLRRVSIFGGGWTLEAAEAVCAGGTVEKDDILDLLSHLIDKSLVTADQHGDEARYSLLETVRQYGVERLRESGEESALLERHFEWLLRLAERADAEFSRPEQGLWFRRLEAEVDNLRAALRWSIEEALDADRGLRLCGVLWRFWQAYGHIGEGRAWLDAALSLDRAAPASLRARALHGASALTSAAGDFERAQRLLEQGLALRRALADDHGTAHTLQRLGIMAYYVGDYQRAAMLEEESLTLCRKLDDQRGVGRAVDSFGIIAMDQGDYEQAAARFAESLTIHRRFDHKAGLMGTLNNLGETARHLGQLDRAEKLLKESLLIAEELGDKGWVARSMHILGKIALSRGNHQLASSFFERALRILHEIGDVVAVHALEGFACLAAVRGEAGRAFCLAEAASAQREAMKMKRPAPEQLDMEQYLGRVEPSLSHVERQHAVAAGRAMNLEQAVACALSPTHATP